MSEKLSGPIAAMYKDKIRKRELPNDQVRRLFDEGKFDPQELLSEGVVSQSFLDQLYYISPEEHLDNIRRNLYDAAKIRGLVERGEIYQADLEGIYRPEVIDEIMGRPVAAITVDFGDWHDVPPLKPNRVDVFVLGLATSGKSAFMSGLIYYAYSKGRLVTDIDYAVGAKYADTLIYAVRNSRLPPRTPVEYIQYMACDFKDNQGHKHPLTFLEMSGENFQRVHFAKEDKIPGPFRQYLYSTNQKIIFLTIDYFIDSGFGGFQHDSVTQSQRFEYILKFYDKIGTLKSTEAVCILITKWDLCKNPDKNAAIRDFLNKEYLSLLNLTKELQAKYGFKFEVYTFSLGEFDHRNSYVYNERDSEHIFNWLCSFSPVTNAEKKGGWLKNLFK